MADQTRINNHAGLIWSIADLLRGDYKQSEYGRVILPLVVLRRLDCVLEPTKQQVRARLASLEGRVENVGPILQAITGIEVYNTSPLTLKKILADPSQVAGNLRAWIAAFDEETRDVVEKFDFDAQIGRLDRAKLLYLVLAKVTEVDLHPDVVSNVEMGYLYEELVRKFSELCNETAGEHFTPREVIRLMVDLLFIEDDEALRTPGIVRTMLDPACGTGGMLSVAAEYLRELNPGARLEGYGQELNAETYAICRSDMMLKGQKASNIRLGNSFSEDAFKGARYDYLLANPPFGVEWKKVQREIQDEHDKLGFGGRFGAGLPRINDGSFLFLQHMISKLKRPEEGGGRLAIVFNGSPLFTGGAGSGESEIRRWIIENDWLEGIVALPRPALLQHRDQHLLLDRHQPQEARAPGQGPARRCPRAVHEDAEEPGQQAQRDRPRPDRRDHPPLRRVRGERAGEDPPERVVRVPADHRRAPAPPPVRGHRGDPAGHRDSAGWAKLTEPERLALVGRSRRLNGISLRRTEPRSPDASGCSRRPSTRWCGTRSRSVIPMPRSSPTARGIPSRTLTSATTRTSRCRDRSRDTTRTRPSVWPRRPTVPPSMTTWRRRSSRSSPTPGWTTPRRRSATRSRSTRQFYRYVPPRPLEEIDAEIKALEEEIQRLLREVTT